MGKSFESIRMVAKGGSAEGHKVRIRGDLCYVVNILKQ